MVGCLCMGVFVLGEWGEERTDTQAADGEGLRARQCIVSFFVGAY